jgi:hypothetical protein
MVDATFVIDSQQIMDYARTLDDGPRIVQRELLLGMEGGVTDLFGDVRDLTPKCRTEDLRRSLQREIRQSGRSITGTVKSLGSIAPYNRFVHDGRGPVVAKPGKVLRLVLCNGQVLYRKRVRAAKANPFMDRGLAKATPRILKRIDAATERIVFQLAR